MIIEARYETSKRSIIVKDLEEFLRDKELIDVCAHIGNVIRLAAIVGIDEVDAACRCSSDSGIHAMLLDPTREPQTPLATRQNLRLLGAFRAFRSEIQCITEYCSRPESNGTHGELSDDPPSPNLPAFMGVTENR